MASIGKKIAWKIARGIAVRGLIAAATGGVGVLAYEFLAGAEIAGAVLEIGEAGAELLGAADVIEEAEVLFTAAETTEDLSIGIEGLEDIQDIEMTSEIQASGDVQDALGGEGDLENPDVADGDVEGGGDSEPNLFKVNPGVILATLALTKIDVSLGKFELNNRSREKVKEHINPEHVQKMRGLKTKLREEKDPASREALEKEMRETTSEVFNDNNIKKPLTTLLAATLLASNVGLISDMMKSPQFSVATGNSEQIAEKVVKTLENSKEFHDFNESLMKKAVDQIKDGASQAVLESIYGNEFDFNGLSKGKNTATIRDNSYSDGILLESQSSRYMWIALVALVTWIALSFGLIFLV